MSRPVVVIRAKAYPSVSFPGSLVKPELPRVGYGQGADYIRVQSELSVAQMLWWRLHVLTGEMSHGLEHGTARSRWGTPGGEEQLPFKETIVPTA